MTANQIDWQRVCLDLRRHYGPLSRVAKELGLDWQHLNRLARGEVAEPRFNSGMRLLDLHARHCGDQHQQEHIRT